MIACFLFDGEENKDEKQEEAEEEKKEEKEEEEEKEEKEDDDDDDDEANPASMLKSLGAKSLAGLRAKPQLKPKLIPMARTARPM